MYNHDILATFMCTEQYPKDTRTFFIVIALLRFIGQILETLFGNATEVDNF